MLSCRLSGLLMGLCTLAVLPACGVRSGLEVGSSEGGSGGSGAATASTGVGAGGSSNGWCSSLTQQEIRSFDDALGYVAHVPGLMASSLDGEQVSLLVRAEPEPVPPDGGSLMTQVTFMPWGAWSGASLGVDVPLAPANAFTLPQQPSDGLSFYASFSTQATGPGMLYAVETSTTEAYPPIVAVGTEAYRQTFMTAGHDGLYGVGHAATTPGPVGGEVQRGNVGLASPGYFNVIEVACTDGPMHIDAVRVKEGYLAAITQGNFCGEAESITAFHYGSDFLVESNPVKSLSIGLLQLKMVPRGGGAWLVWQDDDAENAGPLQAMPLTAEGKVAGAVVQLLSSGKLFTRMSVAAFGEGLAVAYTDAFDPSTPNIVLELFDGAGELLTSTSIAPDSWPRIDEPYALLASPDADAVLLAWSGMNPDPTIAGNAQTYLTRFDCNP